MRARGRRTQQRQAQHREVGIEQSRLDRAAARRVRETDRIARELAALRVGHRIKKRRRTS
jgi:hypothetical protein